LLGQKVTQILAVYLGLIERNLLTNSSVQSRLILCVRYDFSEYPDQRHPSTSPITFPIQYRVLSSRSIKMIGIGGLSSQKLILSSPHLGFLLANFHDSYNPVGLS
jgi:hypothetical protein